VEPDKVLGPVDEHFDAVAHRSTRCRAAPLVDLGGGVAAFTDGQEPVVESRPGRGSVLAGSSTRGLGGFDLLVRLANAFLGL
jgi:hypothetical protein